MNRKEITFEFILYGIILIFGLLIRVINLGEIPLSDYEARIALDGQQLISGHGALLHSDQTFLSNILGVLFYFFGTGNFVSRILSMAIGSLFILLPALFRPYLNRKALLILSCWIAFSPTFVSISRQIDSSILFLSAFGVFIFFLLQKKPLGSAIFLVISLLSGKIFFWNLILLTIVALYVNVFNNNKEFSTKELFYRYLDEFKFKKFVFTFLISYILISTFGFVFPNQFSGAARSFMAFVNVFSGHNLIGNLGETTRGIVFYEIAALVFGIFGLIWLIKRKPLGGLSILGIVTINLVMIILATEKLFIWNIFLIFPLMISGSFFLSHSLTLPKEKLYKTLLITTVAFVIVTFIVLAFASMFSNQNQSVDQTNIRVLYILAGLGLIIGAGLLAGWALSWEIAGKSYLLLSILCLTIFTISAMWNASGLRKPFQNELLRIDQIPIDEDLLIGTLHNFSSWNYKNDYKLNILVIDKEIPSIEWALRNFTNVSFENSIPRNEIYDVIITSSDLILEQSDSFRGQDILWFTEPRWQEMGLSETTQWVLTRRIPDGFQSQESLIIWIRNGLVPGFEQNS
jgi:hypothetical protein